MAIPPRRLTKKAAESIQATDKAVQVRDTEIPGFGVLVTPNGHRSYFLHYQVGRKRDGAGVRRRFVTLGKHGVDLTVDQARDKARQMRQLARAGTDPVEARQLPALPPPLTVASVARRYLAEFSRLHHKPRSHEEVTRLFDKHILPRIGGSAILEMRRSHVADLHAAVSKDAPIAANRMLAAISGLFTFAAEKELVPDGFNPARGITKNPERARTRFLSAREAARFAAAIRQLRASGEEGAPRNVNPILADLFDLLLLTGARRGEMATLKWRQIDWDLRSAEIASKTGQRIVYFSPPAIAVLGRLSSIRIDGHPYVFWGAKPDEPVKAFKGAWARVKAIGRLDDGADAPLVIHGLRHSYATHARNCGEDINIVGRLLGHRMIGITENYAHVFSKTLQDANDRIGEVLRRMCSP